MKELAEAVQENLERAGNPIPGATTPIAEDFEQWLSYLTDDPPWLSDSDMLRNRGAFMDVSRAVHEVLSERQDAAVGGTSCPDWLGKLVAYWQREEAKVITFNYDLLVELAWQQQHPDYDNDSWDHLYPVPLPPIGSRTQLVWSNLADAKPGLRLIKLHGSLSWWYSGPGSPAMDAIYDAGLTPDKGWSMEGLSPFRDITVSSRDRVPMIVPPAAVKSPYYNNLSLRALWSEAASAISAADELVFMGFSLPPSDLVVSSMLATNFAINTNSIIVPVNRSADVVCRLEQTFGLGDCDDPNYVIDDHIVDQYVGRDDAIPAWVDAFAN